MEISLRDYQQDAIDRLRQAFVGMDWPRRIILQAETGAGKSVMVLWPIKSAYEKGKHSLVVCRGRELVQQMDAHLWSVGVPHGVVMAGEEFTPAAIHVCSKDTLLSWAHRRQRMQWPLADLLILDECHECMAKTWQTILDVYRNATVIGLTATPVRADGQSLSPTFSGMIQTAPTSELIEGGYLVQTRVLAPFRPDLKGVPTSGGDYAKKPLADRMDRMELVGNIVQHWKEHGEDRLTICYAVNCDHARHICDQFKASGILAEHVDGETPTEERDATLARLKSGEIRIVTSVGVLVQGVDIPPASCAIDAQPTKSFGRQRQKWGRIKRPWEGKKDCLVLDHAGNVYRHGLPDMDIDWRLEPGSSIQDKIKNKLKLAPPITCQKCKTVYSGQRACPNCGTIPTRQAKPQPTRNGKLVEIETLPEIERHEALQRQWRSKLAIAAARGQTAKAAAAMFKSATGLVPWKVPGLSPMPRYEQWGMSVRVLYPGFCKIRT